MKRISLLFLCVALTAFISLSSCGVSTESTTTNDAAETKVETKEDTPAATKEVIKEDGDITVTIIDILKGLPECKAFTDDNQYSVDGEGEEAGIKGYYAVVGTFVAEKGVRAEMHFFVDADFNIKIMDMMEAEYVTIDEFRKNK